MAEFLIYDAKPVDVLIPPRPSGALPWLVAFLFALLGAGITPLLFTEGSALRGFPWTLLAGTGLGGVFGFYFVKGIRRIPGFSRTGQIQAVLALYLGVIAINVFLLSFPATAGLGWQALNLATLAPCFFLFIATHESGHALAGWLLGLRLYRIQIGIHAETGLNNIGNDESENESERRDNLKIQKGFTADASDLLDVARPRDSRDNGAEDDWANHHFDQ